jgi:hypothetical protein
VSSFLVFNHHSLPFDSKEEANTAIPLFLTICLKAQNVGLTTILMDESVDRSWFRLKLAHNFHWQDWYNLNNDDQNKDVIRAFRSILTKQPLFDEAEIGEGLNIFEVTIDNCEYSALQAAAWNEAPITSFPTRSPWNRSPLTVSIRTIDENEELCDETKDIHNFYSLATFLEEEPHLIELRNSLIQNAQELFIKRNELFPNIVFCGKVIEQLNGWSAPMNIFKQVKESLTALNIFCENWKNNNYQAYSTDNLRQSGLNRQVSGESETVHNNPELRALREFYLPDGNKKMFENHIKLSEGFRIHFYPEISSKKIFIAYIGKHLRLV